LFDVLTSEQVRELIDFSKSPEENVAILRKKVADLIEEDLAKPVEQRLKIKDDNIVIILYRHAGALPRPACPL